MKDIIAFDSLESAETLEKTAWIGAVKQAVDEGYAAKLENGTLVTDLSGYSDNDVGAMKISGHLDGLITDNGSTIRFADIEQAYDQNPPKWYLFAKSLLALQTAGYIDLSGHSVIELPGDWLEPLSYE